MYNLFTNFGSYKLGDNSENLFVDGDDMAMNTSEGALTTSTPGMDDTLNNTNVGPVWFAIVMKGDTSRKSVNFRTLVTPAGNGADVVVSKESVSFMNERLRNTLYGFFLGKHVADVMESMLENGLLLIRSVSLILQNWTLNTKIMMYDVCNIPVLVKSYDILITIFTKDGLIAIATKLINTLMLDSYTVAMCTYSWGKASHARAKIELQDDVYLNTTHLAERNINFKASANLILVDDDEKPLNKVVSDAVNTDSESDVKVAYDEISQFMASGGVSICPRNWIRPRTGPYCRRAYVQETGSDRGQETFASSFRRLPRSGVEFEQWRDMLESLDGVLLSPVEDRWNWVLNGSGVFTVASARQYISFD
nr:hypothetical protein [Tanacetum cinerariifolium]